jgi:UDP-N-acetylglucosamine 1-carboxyvinyltransferase
MTRFFIPEYLTIDGGNPVDGHITISGAKNEVLGVMAAAVLTDQLVVLENVPHISDVLDMGKILLELGVDVRFDPDSGRMEIHAKKITSNVLSKEAYKFRASYYLWGALLARFSITHEFDSLYVKLPGGCSFGNRKFNFQLELLENIFGAQIKEDTDKLEFILPKKISNESSPIFSTSFVSHGATFGWLLSVATWGQEKFIYNAAQEYEVPHFLGILNKMGSTLRGTGSTAIMSKGKNKLLNGGTFKIMPDRMETGSYVLLALATRGKIKLDKTDANSCRPWLNSVLEIAGPSCAVINTDSMEFDFSNLQSFKGRCFIASPVPGKETDMFQIWVPVLATAETESRILDPIWPDRNAHFAEMEKFGLVCNWKHAEMRYFMERALDAHIMPSKFHAADAAGMDLRGTFGLVLCAAIASGHSIISTPSYALRGYPEMIKKLQNIGVHVSESKEGQELPKLPMI